MAVATQASTPARRGAITNSSSADARSAEVVRAAWKLFQEHAGEGLPVSAVIYSHSHTDHWGGVHGIVDEADVRSGKIPIIAPRDFMDHTISENVYAGNAMNRRLFYQYGLLLPASPYGYAGQGLGQGTSSGVVGLIAPTRIVEDDIEKTIRNLAEIGSDGMAETDKMIQRIMTCK